MQWGKKLQNKWKKCEKTCSVFGLRQSFSLYSAEFSFQWIPTYQFKKIITCYNYWHPCINYFVHPPFANIIAVSLLL